MWLYGYILFKLFSLVLSIKITPKNNAPNEQYFENLDFSANKKGCILIANHQSFLDIYLLSQQKISNLCFIVRKWPFKKLFFFAPVMRQAGYIEIENSEPEDFIKKCQQELRSGSLLVCFPEGHRSRNKHLQRFYSGIFWVAIMENSMVFPMVFHNSADVCPAGTFTFNPQEIRISMLDGINPKQFKDCALPHRAMSKYAKKIIQNHLNSEF